MTRALLLWLSERRGALSSRLFLALLVLGLIPLTTLIDATRQLLRVLHQRSLLAAHMTSCPAGHRVELQGAWLCHCGMVFEGSAWAPCPACDGTRSLIRCACGRTLMNPLPGEDR